MAKTRSRTTNEEIVRHFEARTDALDIAQTTRTPRGQILDWIPRESQTSDGAIASPPPDGAAERGRLGDGERLATFELDHFPAERGPSGTVPVVRKDFDRIQTTKSLGEYLAKQGKRSRAAAASGEAPPDPAPDPFGYYHASSLESATAFGCDTVINVWQPRLENTGDHSIMQLGLQNHDLAQLQSIEAGWEVSHDHYGDWGPHLFVYYTTNGYTDDGDNLGGYNRDVDGWVQTDDTIFPAALINGVSTRGGAQDVITIKCQLYESNWWIQVQGRWVGYYPASLFMGNQSVFSTLGDHADWIGFWGEVYTDDSNPNFTRTQMGSGAFGEAGFGQASYQNNLRIQSNRGGTMTGHNGSPSAENSAYYDIVPTMNSGTDWGSYFYAGGPGALIPWGYIGGFFPAGAPLSAVGRRPDQLDVFICGNDGAVYTNWWNPGDMWPGAQNDWAYIGGFFPPGAPVTAVSRNPDQIDLFICGNDGVVYTNWWNPGDQWPGRDNNWAPIGGFFPPGARVAAVGRRPDQLDLFVCGNDGVAYTNWWNPGDQWPGRDNDWAPIGGFFPPGASIAAVSRNPDQIDLFICGNDGVVYTNWWNPGDQWPGRDNNWASIGGFFPPGAPPAAVARRQDQLDVFICGYDGVVYTNWWNPGDMWPGAQNDWAPIGGFFPRGTSISAVSRNPDQLDIFICGYNGLVYTNWWNPGDQWPGRNNDWASIGGTFPAGAPPAAVSRNPDQLDVFITGNDGVVYTNWWNPSDQWPGSTGH